MKLGRPIKIYYYRYQNTIKMVESDVDHVKWWQTLEKNS